MLSFVLNSLIRSCFSVVLPERACVVIETPSNRTRAATTTVFMIILRQSCWQEALNSCAWSLEHQELTMGNRRGFLLRAWQELREMGTYIFCFFVVTHVSVGSDPTSAKSRDSMFDTERVTKGDESRPNWRHLVYRFMCLFEPNLFPQFDSIYIRPLYWRIWCETHCHTFDFTLTQLLKLTQILDLYITILLYYITILGQCSIKWNCKHLFG